jgi:hypothetical protein
MSWELLISIILISVRETRVGLTDQPGITRLKHALGLCDEASDTLHLLLNIHLPLDLRLLPYVLAKGSAKSSLKWKTDSHKHQSIHVLHGIDKLGPAVRLEFPPILISYGWLALGDLGSLVDRYQLGELLFFIVYGEALDAHVVN